MGVELIDCTQCIYQMLCFFYVAFSHNELRIIYQLANVISLSVMIVIYLIACKLTQVCTNTDSTYLCCE